MNYINSCEMKHQEICRADVAASFQAAVVDAKMCIRDRLYLLKQQENEEKASDIRGEVKEIGWGNQIRSYVMQPYKLVKDHRTNTEISNVDSVMDGNIDPFINAYLKWRSIDKNKAE